MYEIGTLTYSKNLASGSTTGAHFMEVLKVKGCFSFLGLFVLCLAGYGMFVLEIIGP